MLIQNKNRFKPLWFEAIIQPMEQRAQSHACMNRESSECHLSLLRDGRVAFEEGDSHLCQVATEVDDYQQTEQRKLIMLSVSRLTAMVNVVSLRVLKRDGFPYYASHHPFFAKKTTHSPIPCIVSIFISHKPHPSPPISC